MLQRNIAGLLCALLAWSAMAMEPPPRNVALTFGLFDGLCIESNGKLSEEHPPLAQLLQAGVAKSLSEEERAHAHVSSGKAWSITMGENGERHQFLFTQTAADSALCAQYSNHGSSEDIRDTLRHMVDVFAKQHEGVVAAMKKPLMNNEKVLFEAYEVQIPGKAKPAIFSLSTTDEAAVRPMRHTLVYEAARE